MNIKKLAIFLILLAVIIGAGFVFLQYRNSVVSEPKTQISDAPVVEDKTITDNAKPFTIGITYPQIKGVDSFNKIVEDTINNELTQFKKNSLENDEAIKKIDPESYAQFPREYDLNISYTKGQIDENVISFILEIYNFEGGAHGATYFIPLNYDIRNKEEPKKISLPDLFPGQADYLSKVSAFCITDLKKQLTDSGGIEMSDDEWLQRGAGPTAENYSIFLINKDNVVFYFPQYQVAAYAAGDFKVIMPR